MPAHGSEATAVLLVRVWIEPGDPATVRFRILTAEPERPTHVVNNGQGPDALAAAVHDWAADFVSDTDFASDTDDRADPLS